MKRFKAGKAGFTDKAHLNKRSDCSFRWNEEEIR